MHGNPLHDLIFKSEAQDLAAALPFHKRPTDPHDIGDAWMMLVKSGRDENVPVLHAWLPYNNWPDNQLCAPLTAAAIAQEKPMVNALLAVGADPLYKPTIPGRKLQSPWTELYCARLLFPNTGVSPRATAIAQAMEWLLEHIGESGRIREVSQRDILNAQHAPLIYQMVQYVSGDASLGALLKITDPLAHLPYEEWETQIRDWAAMAKASETPDPAP